jgi:hypothetical protein
MWQSHHPSTDCFCFARDVRMNVASNRTCRLSHNVSDTLSDAVLIRRLRSITIPLHSTTLDSCSQVEQRSHAAWRDPFVASYGPHQDSSICAPTAKTRLTGPLLQTTPLYFFVIKEHYSLLVLRRPAAPKHLRRDS